MSKVFGVLLEKVPTTNGIPFVVDELITYLTAKQSRIECEGIFRISGKVNDIAVIKSKYDKGETVDLSKYDIHTVAAVLKAYFRELPDSLLTHDNTDMVIATVQMDEKFHPTKIKNLQNILTFLPDVYYETLKTLLHYLKQIADASSINKMTVANISVSVDVSNIFSPDNSACFACTRFFIENYDEVFSASRNNNFKTMQMPKEKKEPEKNFLATKHSPSAQVASHTHTRSSSGSHEIPKRPIPKAPNRFNPTHPSSKKQSKFVIGSSGNVEKQQMREEEQQKMSFRPLPQTPQKEEKTEPRPIPPKLPPRPSCMMSGSSPFQ